jgi:hypothetical protein
MWKNYKMDVTHAHTCSRTFALSQSKSEESKRKEHEGEEKGLARNTTTIKERGWKGGEEKARTKETD